MNNKYEMSAMDSWISFSPGKRFRLDAALQDKWLQRARDFRKLRGDILTASFAIENLIDQVLAETLFPGLTAAPEENAEEVTIAAYVKSAVLKSIFEDVFLRTSGKTLGRKVNLLKDVSNEVTPLSVLLTDQIKADLRRCVDIRNAFGHNPITFEPVGDDNNLDFSAVIVVAGELVELTQAVCDEYREYFLSTRQTLSELFEILKSNPNREGKSPLSRDGIIWMGHNGLSDEEWRVKNLAQPLDLRDFYLVASRPNLKLDIEFNETDNGETGVNAKSG